VTTKPVDELADAIRSRVEEAINTWAEAERLPPLEWAQSDTPEPGWRGNVPKAWAHPSIGSSDADLRAIDTWGKLLGLDSEGVSGWWSGDLGKWTLTVQSPWVSDPAPHHQVAHIPTSARLKLLEFTIDETVAGAINEWGQLNDLPAMNWYVSADVDIALDGVPRGDTSSVSASEDVLRWVGVLGGLSQLQSDPYACWLYHVGPWQVAIYYIRDLKALLLAEPDHPYFASGTFDQ
jgi:hypothetical protein